ncbi:tetratricopeptide repeat protein [Streptomyces broussonetiae]|uniref:tetratricopeptide repeat protein n=1 Tax=Streptomyces broussonetiae TaxID=2686304 RepID=UPI00131BB8FF|nr:tetratricopeptide repeat protein [Streptomyces broussonetiae]
MANTGDGATFDLRRTEVSLGSIKDPGDANSRKGLNNLPAPDNEHFIGRENVLVRLGEILNNGAGVITQTIHGLGGVGKSRVALEYARKGVADRSLTWWITADSEGSLNHGLATSALAVEPTLSAALDTEQLSAWAMKWLQTHDDWLLILDNVEDHTLARSFTGRFTRGKVVLTSRRRHGWAGIGQELEIDTLSRDASVELLARVASIARVETQGDLNDIASEVGDLPLALLQAGAYIAQTKISPSQYLKRLRSHPYRMFSTGGDEQDPARTIARIWNITLDAVRERDPGSVPLLELLSFYGPQSLPRYVLRDALDDEIAVDEALRALSAYSMISLSGEEVSTHRLVQAVVRSRTNNFDPHNDRITRLSGTPAKALELLSAALPKPDVPLKYRREWSKLIPHVEAFCSYGPRTSSGTEFGELLHAAGTFYRNQHQGERAIELHKRALELVNGHDDLKLKAKRLTYLADAHRVNGDFTTALEIANQAVQLSQETHGELSFENIDPLLIRALISHTTGDSDGAVADMQLMHEILRNNPVDTVRDDTFLHAMTLSAAIAETAGLYEQGLEVLKGALQIVERYGDKAREAKVSCLSALAVLYRHLDRPQKALTAAKNAYQISQEIYDEGNLSHISIIINLAGVYKSLNRYSEAIALAEKALRLAVENLGENNSFTAVCMNNLASYYIDTGQCNIALPLTRKALQITEETLGAGHPTVANRLSQIATLFFRLGRYTDALPYAERAVRILSRTVPYGHPRAIASLENLAVNYLHCGEVSKGISTAREGYRQSLAKYGSTHPTTQLLKRLAADFP